MGRRVARRKQKSEWKLWNGRSRKLQGAKTASFCRKMSRSQSYRATNQHPNLLRSFMTHDEFLDPLAFVDVRCQIPWLYSSSTWKPEFRVTDLRWRSPICGFLRFSAKTSVFCEDLRFSAVSCALQMQEFPGEGVNLRKSAVFSATSVPSP